MHVDVSSIIQTIFGFAIAWLAFKENSKKSDIESDQDHHDYIKDQNERLNEENEKLSKENAELTEKNLKLQRKVDEQRILIDSYKKAPNNGVFFDGKDKK